MNVEGMEPFECKVANYVKSFHATVLYRVTPVFSGDDLVARGVLMEAMSLDAKQGKNRLCKIRGGTAARAGEAALLH